MVQQGKHIGLLEHSCEGSAVDDLTEISEAGARCIKHKCVALDYAAALDRGRGRLLLDISNFFHHL